jgi:cytochrome c oxidase cbb3-type subunit III
VGRTAISAVSAAAVAAAVAGLIGAALLMAWPAAEPSRTTDSASRDAVPAASALAALAANSHEHGRQIYNFRCYFCHGYSGDAKTLAATFLSPPPRDFTAAPLTQEQIERALREGRAGTAMASYQAVLNDADMHAVAAFVAREFVRDKARNTAYHTPENGWPRHERFAAAFPFARGEVALDAPLDSLGVAQRAGRELFVTTCISCHDRARVLDAGPAWSARPLSYPRMGFVPGQPNTPPVDAVSSASVYAKHEVAPRIVGLNARERRGQALFQANCAFCHGADGTGKNWIGQFMEPKARDLTQYTAQSMPLPRLETVLRDGLQGTSMPAWKGVLAPAEIDALSAYVVRAFFKPAAPRAGLP